MIVDLGDLLGADQVNVERRRGAGRELLAHEVHLAVRLAADVGDDVVGRAVDAALLDGVDDRLAASAR